MTTDHNGQGREALAKDASTKARRELAAVSLPDIVVVREDFDDWLKAHDAEVAATALREVDERTNHWTQPVIGGIRRLVRDGETPSAEHIRQWGERLCKALDTEVYDDLRADTHGDRP